MCDATLVFIKRCNVLSAIIGMVDFLEQRACIKFHFKLEKNATECYEMLKTAFGEQAIGRSQTFQCFSRFKAGRTSIDHDECSGRPVRSNIKSLLICFFDQKGIFHKEFVPTVNAALYIEVLKHLWENVAAPLGSLSRLRRGLI